MPHLTKREWHVLLLLVHGWTGPQVARQMGVQGRTVEVHRYRLMVKLGFNSVVELMHRAFSKGLVSALDS